jgi:hypothetical protein
MFDVGYFKIFILTFHLTTFYRFKGTFKSIFVTFYFLILKSYN